MTPATIPADDLVLHPAVQEAMRQYMTRPAQALLISGLGGSGKAALAGLLARQLLSQGTGHPATTDHPYMRTITPTDGKTIPIKRVRELRQFLNMTVPGGQGALVNRAVVIADAHLMTREAQNALLKTLEEPPASTVIILTATDASGVLPTIRSRVRILSVPVPDMALLTDFFVGQGYDKVAVGRALLIAGRLPGLTTALLQGDTTHPLFAAATQARGILQSKSYERLLLVDGLSKQKELCLDIVFVLQQMSRAALMKPASVQTGNRWLRIMKAASAAEQQLQHNAQAKLVLTNLMLAF